MAKPGPKVLLLNTKITFPNPFGQCRATTQSGEQCKREAITLRTTTEQVPRLNFKWVLKLFPKLGSYTKEETLHSPRCRQHYEKAD